MYAAFPGTALNAVLTLSLEVLLQIINDECPLKWTSQPAQVLDECTLRLCRVLAVKSVLDQRAIFVKLVQDKVGVSLVSCREDHDLVKFSHVCQESHAEWTNLVYHAAMLEMHECLVQV